MPRAKNFYEGTNYTQQMVTIDKDVYARLRSVADADMKRRLKGGDVVKVLFELVDKHVPAEVVEAAFDEARKPYEKITNRDLIQAVPSLTDFQREQIARIINHPQE
jgi:hypothetical protein